MFHLWKALLCALLRTPVATELCSQTAQRGKLERKKKRKTKSLGDGKCVKKVLPPSGENQSYSVYTSCRYRYLFRNAWLQQRVQLQRGWDRNKAIPYTQTPLWTPSPQRPVAFSAIAPLPHSVIYNLLTQSACSVSHARVLAEPAHKILSVGRDRMVEHTVFIHPLVAGATLSKSVVGTYAGSVAQEEPMVLWSIQQVSQWYAGFFQTQESWWGKYDLFCRYHGAFFKPQKGTKLHCLQKIDKTGNVHSKPASERTYSLIVFPGCQIWTHTSYMDVCAQTKWCGNKIVQGNKRDMGRAKRGRKMGRMGWGQKRICLHIIYIYACIYVYTHMCKEETNLKCNKKTSFLTLKLQSPLPIQICRKLPLIFSSPDTAKNSKEILEVSQLQKYADLTFMCTSECFI